jgi:pimeloyl-ACP methyl ester carboxylesterase
MLGRRDLAPVLPGISCPTLVLCGADDTYSPPDQHRSMAAAIPDARLVVIPECGHMAPMERSDAVSAALRQWLTSE